MIFDFLKTKNWKKCGNAWTGHAIADQFERLSTPPAFSWRRDRDYQALPREDFAALVWRHWTPTDYPQYSPEEFDCDDFADVFIGALRRAWAKKRTGRALAFGYIEAMIERPDLGRIARHAFIWAMDPAGKIYFVEPQTGGPMTAPVRQICLVEI